MSRYRDIVPLHYQKVAAKVEQVEMKTITEDLSLYKQNMFFIKMESENCITTKL